MKVCENREKACHSASLAKQQILLNVFLLEKIFYGKFYCLPRLPALDFGRNRNKNTVFNKLY